MPADSQNGAAAARRKRVPGTSAKSAVTPARKAPKRVTSMDEATRAIDKGWLIYPQNRRKEPRISGGINAASSDPEQLRAWASQFPGCNWAVATGAKSGIVVVDVDPRNGGVDPLLDRLPATRTVSTGGGGLHFYFEYPAGAEIRKGEIAPGVEVLGDGASATLPGSVHSSGKPYRVTSRRPLAALPDEVRQRYVASKERPAKSASKVASEEQALPAQFQLAVERLRQIAEKRQLPKPRLSLDGRGLWTACCPAHDDHDPSLSLAVGDRQAVVLTCHAGCDVQDIVQALGMDWREFSTTRPGRRPRVDWQVLGIADATRIATEPIDEVVPGLLAAMEKAVIGGPPKQLKTWLALQLAKSVACGEPFLGDEIWTPASQPVLFVQEEGARHPWARRVSKVFEDVPEAPFKYLHRARLSLADEDSVAMLAEISAGMGARLIFIDPWQRVTSGMKESDAAETGPAWDAVHRLAADAGAAVVLLHHTRKDADLSMDSLRGSSRMAGEVDLLMLMRKASDGRLELRVDGREFVRPELQDGHLTITYGDEPWSMLRSGVVAHGKNETVKGALLQILKPDVYVSTASLTEQVGTHLGRRVTKEAVRKTLNALGQTLRRREVKSSGAVEWSLR